MPKKLEEITIKNASETEVAIHELGESLALSILTIQNELARYPNDLGAFFLDEIELDIPISVRIDELGQLRVQTVKDKSDEKISSQIRICIRPALGESQIVPHDSSNQPLSSLGDLLSPENIKNLEKLRIFSVEDFLRISRNINGQRALSNILPKVKIQSVIDRSTLFTIPEISAPLAITLVDIGVTSAADLMKRDSKTLTAKINKRIKGNFGKKLIPEDVKNLQSSIKQRSQINIICKPESSRSLLGQEIVQNIDIHR